MGTRFLRWPAAFSSFANYPRKHRVNCYTLFDRSCFFIFLRISIVSSLSLLRLVACRLARYTPWTSHRGGSSKSVTWEPDVYAPFGCRSLDDERDKWIVRLGWNLIFRKKINQISKFSRFRDQIQNVYFLFISFFLFLEFLEVVY